MPTASSGEPGDREPESLPGPIDPSEIAQFSPGGTLSLYGEYFAARDDRAPRAAAVIAHGYFEHCGRYRELAHVLVCAGVDVLSYDMRGHGRSDGQRGHIDDIADYLDDLDAALCALDERLQARYPGREIPRFGIAHSNGGLVLLRALADPTRPAMNLAAAVLSSPFLGLKMKVPLAKDLLGRAAGRLVPRLSLPSQLALDDLTSDPEKQRERRLDTLCHEATSARWYACTLAAQDHVAEHAAAIAVPTLWLVSADDRIADPAVARAVQARLRAPSRCIELRDMQHEVFNERRRDRVFDLVTSFIDESFPVRDGQPIDPAFAPSRPPSYT